MRSRTWRIILSLGFVALCSVALSVSAQERWVYSYNGPGDDSDVARSVVYGSDDSIYAAGCSRATSTDFTVISLTNTGDTNWVYTYNGPVDATDDAYSIVYGLDGNLYVVGGSYLTVGRATDFTVISLTSSATERWIYQYDGGAGALDRAYSVAYGADGNIYVAGNCWAGGGNYWDFTIISLPPSEPPANWIYEYDGPGSEMDNSDAAYSIAYGSDGNIYAAGKSYGSGTWRDFTVVSVTTLGTERWVYRHNGSANLDDVANSIIYGGDGNIYAAGYVRNGNRDVIVVSLPPTGPPANWVYIYNGLGNGNDAASSIAYGSDANVYVAGYSVGSASYDDFTVISLTTSGVERWVYTHNGPGDSTDRAASVACGYDGNIYAAGGRTDSLTSYDFTVISLDTAGAERWVYSYDGPANAEDGASSIVMGTDGILYAAGYSYGAGTEEDFTVVSLAPEVGVEETQEVRSKKQEAGLEVSASPIPAANGVKIHYSVPKASEVRLAVYDLRGRLVKNLVNCREEAGSRTVFWNGGDQNGHEVSSGAYFCHLTVCLEQRRGVGESAATRKLVLLR